jgi:hypothetical protein
VLASLLPSWKAWGKGALAHIQQTIAVPSLKYDYKCYIKVLHKGASINNKQ